MIQGPSPKIPSNSMIPGDQGEGVGYQVVNSRCRHSGTNEVVPFPFRTENVGKTRRFPIFCHVARENPESGDSGIPPLRKRPRKDGPPGPDRGGRSGWGTVVHEIGSKIHRRSAY